MSSPTIAFYPGDGIGKEVLPEGRKVLTAAGFQAEWTNIPWDTSLYAKTGRCAPEDALDQLRPFSAIYLGALGDPALAPDSESLRPLLAMRKGFEQYACLRPAFLLPGVRCPLQGKKPGDIDFIVIRENTEGEYADIGGRQNPGTPDEVAMQVNVFTRKGVERIIRFGFETARSRKRKLLTLVNKSNAQRYGNVFMEEVFATVAKEYPDIKTNRHLVDAAAMNFVLRPEIYDVIVTTNLFGDILTDLAAAIMGGLGFAPSANLNPTRTYPSMFEPTHGSAPDIQGRNISNPIATIYAGAMMADFLGQKDVAGRILKAIHDHLADGRCATPDRGGSASTQAVGDDIARRAENPKG
jgi:tartrate dehydrogenase/decarboxylase/D-malate dehydrogenase